MPALRERLDDVPQLVDMLLDRVSKQIGVPRPQISDEAMDKLLSYAYPGNVRELENILERAVTLCADDRIEPGGHPAEAGAGAGAAGGRRTRRPRTGSRGSSSTSSARRSSRRWSRPGTTRPRRRSCWG